jgi:hypothetical protein
MSQGTAYYQFLWEISVPYVTIPPPGEFPVTTSDALPAKFKPYTRQSIATARQWQWMSPDLQEAVQVVSHVLPFRTNEYVMEQLIDWNRIPDDRRPQRRPRAAGAAVHRQCGAVVGDRDTAGGGGECGGAGGDLIVVPAFAGMTF